MYKNYIYFILLFLLLYYITHNYFYILRYYYDRYFNYTTIKLPSTPNKKNILLLSNSSIKIDPVYFNFASPNIKLFVQQNNVRHFLYVPYALASVNDDIISSTTRAKELYHKSILPACKNIGIQIDMLDIDLPTYEQEKIISNAKGLFIGGGNTFVLTHALHKNGLILALKKAINSGIPTISLSAGSILMCPTIKTTNDMSISDTTDLNSLNIIPFQLNLHYNNQSLSHGEGGGTRDKHLCQYLQNNRKIKIDGKKLDNFVIALREGTILHVSDNNYEIVGLTSRTAYFFKLKNGKFTKQPISIGTTIFNL